MKCVTILYPNKEGGKFDFDYFIKKHIPMTKKLLGDKVEIRRGLSDVYGGSPKFICGVRIEIKSTEEFIGVMTQQGQQLIDDMPNYTNIEPVIQFDEVL